MAAVQNRKTDALPLSGDPVFSGFICGDGNDALVSVGLVRLFEIWIALCFLGLMCHLRSSPLFLVMTINTAFLGLSVLQGDTCEFDCSYTSAVIFSGRISSANSVVFNSM